MFRCRPWSTLVLGLAVCALAAVAAGEDWPTWRADPARTASTRESLAAELHLQWTLRLPALKPAWPDEPRMRFDAAHQPIVVGETMYVASSHDDSVAAYDVRDGALRWRWYADGPVRFAPAAWAGRLYVVSDDGCLYCLDAKAGSVHWKLRGGPTDRRLLGNERLVSAWPARGGPVVVPGGSGGATAYFAAGIWPFLGVFVYAVDAVTGQALWCNDASGELYINQPHDSPAFAGIAPQGYLAATGEYLLVPNGRAAAAGLDRRTGRLLYFPHAANKRGGHSEVAAAPEPGAYVNSGALCRLEDGKAIIPLGPIGKHVQAKTFQSTYVYYDGGAEAAIAAQGEVGVLAGGVSYQSAGPVLVARDIRRPITRIAADKRGKQAGIKDLRVLWELPTRARPMVAAGGRLYAADPHEVIAIDLPGAEILPPLPKDPNRLDTVTGDDPLPLPPPVSWRTAVEGAPAGMVAAAGRLFVVTQEGDIHCYGARRPAAAGVSASAVRTPVGDDALAAAGEVLRAAGVAEGYALVLGLRDGRLAESLAAQSRLRVVAIDGDAARVEAFRRRIDRAALPASRLAAVVGDPPDADVAPYLASLIVSEDASALGPAESLPVERLYGFLRPYGGTMCLDLPADRREAFARRVAAAGLAGAELRQEGPWTLLVRRGPLPGAGSWTGQYGNPANTCVSDDDLVRAPLGLLWFGGPSSEGILPRHGHGPPEQVVGGRLFIEGPHLLRAMDVYTGRLLWETILPDVGKPYDNTDHQPGANALGTNFIAADDAVYVVHGRRCAVLDPATGRATRELVLRGQEGDAEGPLRWGYLAVWEGLLVAGVSPVTFLSPEFQAEEFLRKTKDKEGKMMPALSPEALRALVEAVEEWRGLPIARPRTVLDAPPATQPTKPPKPRAAGDVDFLVANLNGMILQQDVLGKLPGPIIAAARARDVKELAKWDEARRLDDGNDAPRPETLDDLQEAIDLLASTGRGELPDGRTATVLRRQVLEHCYPKLPKLAMPKAGAFTLDETASREIVVLDRRTGEVLWRRSAHSSFRHNAICAGGGMLFCVDRLPDPVLQRLARRGQGPDAPAELLALDIRTGQRIWSASGDVFGTWLSYSLEHDALLEAGRPSRDMLGDEPATRMVVYRGRTGKVLWDRGQRFAGPCMLHGRTILTQDSAMDLLTGQKVTRPHPLTDEQVPWSYRRNYGCNAVIASRHLLTFRSAAAGFYDLAGDSGTGNLGGFKSGCTSNLVAADGVLNAPDYTRTCTCSYQNRCSLAMVHESEAELWTFQALDRGKGPIRRLGVNFGAPGDRRAPDGTLWLEYPYVGGRTPDVPIALAFIDEPGRADAGADPLGTSRRTACFRRHPSRAGGEGPAWVAASGVEGVREVTIDLARAAAPPRAYTVRLHFAEPGTARAGERPFDVAIMGRTVLTNLDVAAEAGSPLTSVVKAFTGVRVADRLTVSFRPAAGAKLAKPVLCGVEVVAEGPAEVGPPPSAKEPRGAPRPSRPREPTDAPGGGDGDTGMNKDTDDDN